MLTEMLLQGTFRTGQGTSSVPRAFLHLTNFLDKQVLDQENCTFTVSKEFRHVVFCWNPAPRLFIHQPPYFSTTFWRVYVGLHGCGLIISCCSYAGRAMVPPPDGITGSTLSSAMWNFRPLRPPQAAGVTDLPIMNSTKYLQNGKYSACAMVMREGY